MIILITGATHSGKTVLAQKLLEKYHFPYLSLDHLKMGLIRSGSVSLTPTDADALITAAVWPIAREMIKTAVENHQNLIVEGCYIPFDWKNDFDETYLADIRYCCLVLSEEYIRAHFDEIRAHACDVEQRVCDDCTEELLLRDNGFYLRKCREYGCPYLLIGERYDVDFEL